MIKNYYFIGTQNTPGDINETLMKYSHTLQKSIGNQHVVHMREQKHFEPGHLVNPNSYGKKQSQKLDVCHILRTFPLEKKLYLL